MTKWDTSNKAHFLAREFIARQGRKFSRSDFFRIYSFFKKKDDMVLNLLHEYLSSGEADLNLSMTDLFIQAQKWALESQKTKIIQTKVTDYLALLKEEQYEIY